MGSSPRCLYVAVGMFVALWLGVACGGARSGESSAFDAGPAVRDSGGVEIVEERLDPDRRLTLVEGARIGGDGGWSPGAAAQTVSAVVQTPDGGLILLAVPSSVGPAGAGGRRDRLAFLRAFDRGGTLRAQWEVDAGRECDFNFRAMALTRDTLLLLYHSHCPHENVLLAFDPEEGELLARTSRSHAGEEGTPFRIWPATDGWRIEILRGDHSEIAALDPVTGRAGEPLFRYDFRGEARMDEGRRVEPMFTVRPALGLDPTGRIYFSYQEAYQVALFAPDGRPERIVRPDWNRRPVTEELIEAWEARQRSLLEGRPEPEGTESLRRIISAQREMPTPDFVPPLGPLVWPDARGDGGFLVLRRDLDPNLFAPGDPPTFDAFGPSGRFRGRFQADPGFWPLLFLGDEIVAGSPDDGGDPSVLRYRLVAEGAADCSACRARRPGPRLRMNARSIGRGRP